MGVSDIVRFSAVVMIAVALIAVGDQSFAEEEYATYSVKRTDSPIQIDGFLFEPEWGCAEQSCLFRRYTDSAAADWNTYMQLLWDDEYLYVAMRMTDADVWSTMTEHDDALYEEEVAEIFIDPDGDGNDYIELEINPIGTVMDLVMSSAYFDGGKADWEWTLEVFNYAIFADGTVNDDSDTDVCWQVECAIPFEQIAFSAPSMNWPPENGDSWRMNFYRYERVRDENTPAELTAWNPTGPAHGFHNPAKFGVLVFDAASVIPTAVEDIDAPQVFCLTGNTPNPFNPSTLISFEIAERTPVHLDIYSVHGQLVTRLIDGNVMNAGRHEVVWDGRGEDGTDVSSGVYIVRMHSNGFESARRMMLLR